jgi:hypothetical protein
MTEPPKPVPRRELRAGMERSWTKRRREILLDLVNLSDASGIGVFRRRFPQLDVSMAGDDQAILRLHNQLQKLWRGEIPAAVVMQEWLRQRRPGWEPLVVPQWADGSASVWPNYHILPLSLAFGISEFGSKMAVCANPSCEQKYFLKGRRTQRFCDLPACSAYGQREHKRKWWRIKRGREWKETRKKLRISKSKKNKKGGR